MESAEKSLVTSIRRSIVNPVIRVSTMYRISTQIAFLAVSAAISLGIYSYIPSLLTNKKHFTKISSAKEQVWPVRTIPAQPGRYFIDQQVFGQVNSSRVSNLSFQFSGCIAELDEAVKVGSRVVAGQILASLDVRPLELELKIAQTRIAELHSQVAENESKIENLEKVRTTRMLTLDLSNKSLARQTRLGKKKIIPTATVEHAKRVASETRSSLVLVESEISAARAALLTMRKRILSAKQLEDRARLNLQYAVLIAPHSGVVASISYDSGTCVSAMDSVLRLVDTKALEVQLDLPLHVHRALLAQGAMETWQISGLLAGDQIDLKAIRQVPELSATQQLVRVLAVPRNSNVESTLVPGQNLRAEVTMQQLENVLKLPFSALFDETSLYTVTDDRLVRHKADVLFRDNLTVYARSNITPGTPIVTTQLRTAVPWLRVKILSN